MKRLRFLGSGLSMKEYNGNFYCAFKQVSPPLDDKLADYMLKKMPQSWEVVDSKEVTNPKERAKQVFQTKAERLEAEEEAKHAPKVSGQSSDVGQTTGSKGSKRA